MTHLLTATRHLPSGSDQRESTPETPHLPAWPLLGLLHGFPLFWFLGLAPFITPMAAIVMLAMLARHRPIRLVPGLAPFLAFVVWAALSGVMLESAGQAIGFLHRLGELGAVAVIMLYYVNASPALTPARVRHGLMTIWITLVVLGVAAIFIPEVRISTPAGALLPGTIVNNELVYELVNPRMAEVQQPWGATEPFNRPAAPFPYTNSWGMAFILLTPIAALTAALTRSRWRRAAILSGIAVSLWPAIETSNRGMFLGLGAYLGYLVVRWIGRRRLRPALLVTALGSVTVAVLVATGSVAEILARQEVSNTTEGRGSIYRATLETAMASPLVGWATPRMDPTIGVSLGTQGYLWTLVFCYGFIGAALFACFLAGTLLRSRHLPGDAALVLHGLVAMVCLTIAFYGLGVTQLTVIALAAAMLLRAAHTGEAL